MSSIRPDIVDEARRVIGAARAEHVTLRAIGGVAVQLRARGPLHPALARPYRDVDLVTPRKQGRAAARTLRGLGYQPNERFNAMHGATRLVFYDVEHERQVDVFVGEFRMCHAIPIADRLELDDETVPLAELLLTKLQIVNLNEKDLRDLWAILYEHDVAEDDDETVNAGHIARLLAADWGLWRTSRQTIESARSHLTGTALASPDQALLDDRLRRLWERIEAEPKSLRWRGRAKLGDRSQWYEEPEEISHAAFGAEP